MGGLSSTKCNNAETDTVIVIEMRSEERGSEVIGPFKSVEAADLLTYSDIFYSFGASSDVFISVSNVEHVFYHNVSIFKVIYQINT